MEALEGDKVGKIIKREEDPYIIARLENGGKAAFCQSVENLIKTFNGRLRGEYPDIPEGMQIMYHKGNKLQNT